MTTDAPTATPESPVATTEAPVQEAAGEETRATQGNTAERQTDNGAGTAPIEKLSIMGMEIEKSKVPPELLEKVDAWNKAYTEKSQKLSEAEKKAQQLDQLSNHPAFQKWYYEQLRGPQPQTPPEDPYNLTPERQAELLSDPKRMREYVEGLAKSVVEKYALPAANQARMEAVTLRNEQRVAQLADKYKDFDDLNGQGKIEEVVAKYARQGVDIDLEDAYWLAKRPFMESEATARAHQRVQEKVNGTTLQPSGAPANTGIKPVSGKGLSLEEKMRMAFEASLRNEKIKFVDS